MSNFTPEVAFVLIVFDVLLNLAARLRHPQTSCPWEPCPSRGSGAEQVPHAGPVPRPAGTQQVAQQVAAGNGVALQAAECNPIACQTDRKAGQSR